MSELETSLEFMLSMPIIYIIYRSKHRFELVVACKRNALYLAIESVGSGTGTWDLMSHLKFLRWLNTMRAIEKWVNIMRAFAKWVNIENCSGLNRISRISSNKSFSYMNGFKCTASRSSSVLSKFFTVLCIKEMFAKKQNKTK